MWVFQRAPVLQSHLGRGATAILSRERFVRKGLKGREAVAANIKKHALHVFLYLA
jgi:hypothetical protein